MATTLRELIDNVNADDLPTNEFTIEDKDPMVILGKLNEVIAYLQTLQDTINASDSKATEALQKAIQAVADATQALSVANGIDAKATQALANAVEAVSTANSALSASNTALSTANTAISTANTALSSANSAVETADNALDTAESAETKADTAITTANGAKATAEGIDAKATTALSNSQTAVSTANTANDKATSADTKADTAITTANSADTKADTAITTANTANTNASNAVNTANSASSTASTASQNANTALTTAQTANQNASTALTTANNADSKADSAVATAEDALNQVVAGLGTKVYRDTTLLSNLDIKPIEDDIANNTTAITALQNGKVDKVAGKQLSTEDFTTNEKNKLAGLNNYDDTQVQADITALQNGKANQSDLNATNANVATNATNIATNSSNIANKANTDASNITVASYQDKLKVGKLILNYTTTSNMSSINLTGLNLINDGGVYDIEISYKADTGVDANIQVNGKTSGYNMILLQAFDKGSYSIAGGPNSGAFAIGSVFPNETLLHLTLNQTDTNNAQLSFINIGSDNAPHVYARWGGGRVNPNGSITSIKINTGGNILAGAKIKIYAREK